MAAAKSTTPTLKVPGIEDVTSLSTGPSTSGTGSGIAIFVKGIETFRDLISGEVTLEGSNGKTVQASVVGTQAGRLFALSSQYIGQTPAATRAASQSGNYAFQDVSHFNALADTYGKDAIGPLEPYTVVQVRPVYVSPLAPAPSA